MPLTIEPQILGMAIKYGQIRRQSSMAKTKVRSILRRAEQNGSQVSIALVPLDWKEGLIRDNVSLLCDMVRETERLLGSLRSRGQQITTGVSIHGTFDPDSVHVSF